MVYGKDGSADSVPTGVTITDNAEVTITGTKGIVLTGGADGDITVTDGAVLTVDTDSAAFTKAPVIEAGSEVTVGASPEEAEAWDGSTALTSYNYVRIEAPDEGGETTDTPEEPSDIPSEPSETAPAEPTETVTETPSTPDPDLPTENFSNWVGIQPVRDGKIEWLYDGHYMMPDGTHLSTTNNGEPDGSEAVYYDGDTGTLTFSKDITIYGASDASEYRTYYGTVYRGSMEWTMLIRTWASALKRSECDYRRDKQRRVHISLRYLRQRHSCCYRRRNTYHKGKRRHIR